MTNLKHNHIFLIEDLIVAVHIMCNTTFANRLTHTIQSTGRLCV